MYSVWLHKVDIIKSNHSSTTLLRPQKVWSVTLQTYRLWLLTDIAKHSSSSVLSSEKQDDWHTCLNGLLRGCSESSQIKYLTSALVCLKHLQMWDVIRYSMVDIWKEVANWNFPVVQCEEGCAAVGMGTMGRKARSWWAHFLTTTLTLQKLQINPSLVTKSRAHHWDWKLICPPPCHRGQIHLLHTPASSINAYAYQFPVFVPWKINCWKEKSIFISSAITFRKILSQIKVERTPWKLIPTWPSLKDSACCRLGLPGCHLTWTRYQGHKKTGHPQGGATDMKGRQLEYA